MKKGIKRFREGFFWILTLDYQFKERDFLYSSQFASNTAPMVRTPRRSALTSV